MSFILTLVSSEKPLSTGHLAVIERYLDSQGIRLVNDPSWLKEHKAADIPVSDKPNHEQICAMRDTLAADKIDLFINSVTAPRKKLLLADMDSTIVASETLADIAGYAGLEDKIVPTMESSMRGEITFTEAVTHNVAALEGIQVSVLSKILEEMKLSQGAEKLVKTMAQKGAVCVLVSGGFTFFTGVIAERAGFHHHHGNILEIEGDALTGRIVQPILDESAKLSILKQYVTDLNITSREVMAIGDGANDLPMLLEAGLGVGYRPKPLLAATLDNCIIHGDLTASLYAQGFGVA